MLCVISADNTAADSSSRWTVWSHVGANFAFQRMNQGLDICNSFYNVFLWVNFDESIRSMRWVSIATCISVSVHDIHSVAVLFKSGCQWS